MADPSTTTVPSGTARISNPSINTQVSDLSGLPGAQTTVINLHGRRDDPQYDPALNPQVVYVGRYQFWGAGRVLHRHSLANPFGVKKYGLYDSLTRYTDWFLGSAERIAIAKTMRGRTLGCWCIGTRPACHGLIVAAVADDDVDRIAVVLEQARAGGSGV